MHYRCLICAWVRVLRWTWKDYMTKLRSYRNGAGPKLFSYGNQIWQQFKQEKLGNTVGNVDISRIFGIKLVCIYVRWTAWTEWDSKNPVITWKRSSLYHQYVAYIRPSAGFSSGTSIRVSYPENRGVYYIRWATSGIECAFPNTNWEQFWR